MAIGKKALDRVSRSLVRYREILIGAKKRDVSESDTVVIIGDMMADVLGYEKYVEVSTEFAVKGTYVDLAVKVGSNIHFLVEAKAIGVELKDLHVRQAVDYGANQGIEWAILTNGVVWRIYRIEFKKPISHVLVAEVDLLAPHTKPADAVEFFANLCKEGFAKSQMEEFYEQHQATNRHTLAVLLLSEHMLNQLRIAVRRAFPKVRVDTKMLSYCLTNDVLKRELVDGEEAAAAALVVKKALRSVASAKRRAASINAKAPMKAEASLPVHSVAPAPASSDVSAPLQTHSITRTS